MDTEKHRERIAPTHTHTHTHTQKPAADRLSCLGLYVLPPMHDDFFACMMRTNVHAGRQ